MSWAHPWLLLALILPVVAALRVRPRRSCYPRRWPALIRVAISGERVRPALAPRLRTSSIGFAAMALFLVAAAGPRWGDQEQAAFSHTREVMIALDLSQSMLTEDIEPSRLERSKAITQLLLDALEGESVSLTVFAGTAFVQVPLSPDYQIIREFIPSLGPDYMPQGGSNYASMLDAALDGFTEAEGRDRFLVVLSDGESSTGGWDSRLDDLAERNVHVIALGMGTDEGGLVADPLAGGYLADRDGNVVHSRLEPATLQTLAQRTHGMYLNASALRSLDDVRRVLADTVERGRQGRTANEAQLVQTERFQWFLLPAVLLALLSLYRDFRGRPRPRQVRTQAMRPSRSSYRPPLTVAAAALFWAFAPAPEPQAHFDDEAAFEVRVLFDSDPEERVRAIAAHLADFDYDAFDLRLMVEETIRYGADAERTGTPVEEGVIRDAMEAAVQGERLDDAIADWSYYRAQLEKMLATIAEAGGEDPSDDDRRQLMDEEDSRPVVAGQSTQQSANDSFGQGASAKSDAALGELSLDQEIAVEGRRRPPPAAAQSATVRSPQSQSDAESDPILEFSRERLEEVVRRDAPGRLHQMLVEDVMQQNDNQFDW